MKYLVMFLLSFQATANVSCYTFGNITSCTDGTSVYDFGSMKQVIPPNNKPPITVYQYGSQTQIISPIDFAPTPLNALEIDTPLQPQ